MQARIKAMMAETGDFIQWNLKDTSFEKCKQFIKVCIENDKRITNFTIELFGFANEVNQKGK